MKKAKISLCGEENKRITICQLAAIINEATEVWLLMLILQSHAMCWLSGDILAD